MRGRARFFVVVGGVVAAVQVAPFSAQAEPDAAPRYRLEVLARPGADRCPTVERLAPAVVARVGHDPFDETAAARLSITFERGAKGYDARIERFGPDGTPAGKKSLAGPSCEALADALALSIAIAVDAPLPASRGAPAASSSGRDTAPVPLPPAALPEGWGDAPIAIADPPKPVVTTPGPQPFAQLAMGAAFAGAAPSVAPLATLGLGLSTRRYLVSIDGLGTLPTTARGGGAEVSVGLLGARPAACRRVSDGGHLAICARGFLGVLQGSAEGAGGKRDSTFFASLGGGLERAFPLAGGLSFVPALGISFTLTRTSLYANDHAVFTTRPLGLDASLGLRLAL